MEYNFDAYDNVSECYEDDSDNIGSVDCDSYIESQSF